MTAKKLTFLSLACLLGGLLPVQAQRKATDFGKITPADFVRTAPSFDSAASAVVIADIGKSEFLETVSGFVLLFHHYKRIKILHKNGFGAATVGILLFGTGGDAEKIEGLKAVSYNLEGGKVVETPLDSKSVYTDQLSNYLLIKKFTFPAVKEGTIIEFTYTQYSNFLEHLQPWAFQGEYPCLYSAYEVDLPDFYQYVTLSQGYLPFELKSSDTRSVSFRAGRSGGQAFDENVVDYKWAMKNIPSLKEEPFTTNVGNYVSKIEFQLARIVFPYAMQRDVMGSWKTLGESLLKSESFGADLNRNNGWLDDDLRSIVKDTDAPLDKARKIYAFVRDHFTCTSHSSLYCNHPEKTVFKNRNGSEAEINLLLVAMLNHEHLSADPVILSTRDNGFTHELYPLVSRFNYVIGRLVIDSVTWWLDASEPLNGFGHLPGRCYNGHARIIGREEVLPVILSADSLTEKKTVTVFMSDEGKGVFSGSVQTVYGDFESARIRETLHAKGETAYFKTVQSAYPGEAEFSNTSVDSLKVMEEPLGINYDFRIKNDPEDKVIYFNPMLAEAYKENPFVAAVRRYPVEMPAGMDETYTLNMEIPQGYMVEELPKSSRAALADNGGFFEYLVVKDEKNIQFRSRIRLVRANFKPDDYADLRDFFAFVVKKQSEQIVFKKK